MRDYILVYINGVRHELSGSQAKQTVAEYLRYTKGLTGTKIVCAEGDCGACSLLVSRYRDGQMLPYQSINSCISFMYLFDCCHIVTVEGIGTNEKLHPVQKSMNEHFGAQCGYCTPGFVCALTSMAQDAKKNNQSITAQKVKNYLTGNLCRCTGYEPIIDAGLNIKLADVVPLSEIYQEDAMLVDFKKVFSVSVKICCDDLEFNLPASIEDALNIKSDEVQVISGATDLGVLVNKRKIELKKVLCLNNISHAYRVDHNSAYINIGSKVSLDQLSNDLKSHFPEFTNMLHIFASPQIKNNGTLVGNIVNASPISDTIPFLKVAGAKLQIQSVGSERMVDINDFFKGGYKELDLAHNELVTRVDLPLNNYQYKLYKVSIRKDLDISTVTFAAAYSIIDNKIAHIKIALGGVGPTVLSMPLLENKLIGHKFTKTLCHQSLGLIKTEISPLADLRGSIKFRRRLCENLFVRFFDEVIAERANSLVEISI